MGLSPKKLRKLTYFLKEGLPAYLGGGAGAGIPSLKVKPYVVKYKFQKIIMYCTHPPQCPKSDFCLPMYAFRVFHKKCPIFLKTYFC